MGERKATRATHCWACGELLDTPRAGRVYRARGELRGFVGHPECVAALDGVVGEELAQRPGWYARGTACERDPLPW